MAWEIYLYQALLFLLIRLGIVLLNLRTFPILRPATGSIRPKVSILVPARNEAHNLRETLPLLLAQPADEILLLDDRSDDETAVLAQRLGSADLRFRLLSGEPLPQGWMGKNWACHQLAEAARGEILVFTDADVWWGKGALESLLAQEQAGLVSVFPRQRTSSLVERVLVPLVDVALLGNIPHPLIGRPLISPANGQVMVFSRTAYRACGGHKAVRAEVLEDVRLGQAVKNAGYGIRVLLGGNLIGVRMYRSYGEIIEGFAKNLPSFHLNSSLVLLLSLLGHLGVYSAVWALGFADPRWWLVGALGLLERTLINLKTGREIWEALLVPLAPPLSIPIYLRALRQDYTWKGRAYRRSKAAEQ